MSELTLEQVLGTIEEFGRASAGLVGWEYCSDAGAAEPVIARALAGGLLRPAGRDRQTGEADYELTAQGHAWLRRRDRPLGGEVDGAAVGRVDPVR